MKRYHTKVKYWLTFNEINMTLESISTCSGAMEDHSKQGLNKEQLSFQCIHHMLLASAKAVLAAHAIDPKIKIGNMVWKQLYYPQSVDPMDTIQQRFDMHLNYYFFDIQCKGIIPYYLDQMCIRDSLSTTLLKPLSISSSVNSYSLHWLIPPFFCTR